MIGQRHRFHGHNSLRRVHQNGQTARGTLMNLKASPRPGRPYRAAVVVSRKVSKSAVIRNRIRRRIYEQVRELLPAQGVEFDLVFMVYGEQLALFPTPKLTATVRDLLKRAGVPVASRATPDRHDIVNTKEMS